jgi:hypothetical protein
MDGISYNDVLNDPAPIAEKINAVPENSLNVPDMASVADVSLYRTRC